MENLQQGIVSPYQLPFENPTRDQWYSQRKTTIGASDAAGILGCSTFSTPFKVWASKTQERYKQRETLRMRKGLYMEGFISDLFMERSRDIEVKAECFDFGQYAVLRDDQDPFLTATLDRVVVTDRGVGVLELKDVSRWAADGWDNDQIPPYYWVQVQHQLMVSGLQYGYLAALLSLDGSPDDSFTVRYIERDNDFISDMRAELKLFYANHIEMPNNPPPVDSSAICTDVLKALYPEETNGVLVDFPTDAALWDRERQASKAMAKTCEVQIALNDNRIKKAIGENMGGYYQRLDGSVVRFEWKKQGASRVLRRYETK